MIKIEFKHKGATCPKCGYVFQRGFSDATEALPIREGRSTSDGSLAVCTGCRATLRLAGGQLHVLTVVDELLMTHADRANMRFLDELQQLCMKMSKGD